MIAAATATTKQPVALDSEGKRYIKIDSAYGSPTGTPKAFSTLFYAEDFPASLEGCTEVTLADVADEYTAEREAWQAAYDAL